jgi:hypothetical protein
MPTARTKPDSVGIAELLKNRRLRVPTHQRPFAWSDDEIHELLDDLSGAILHKSEEYFLGSIVVIRGPEDSGWVEVLDGQQRLATVSMILAGIAQRFDSLGDTQRGGAIRQYLTSLDIESGVETPHLRLSAEDNAYFQTLLLGGETPPNPGGPESHARLFAARNHTKEWLVRSGGDGPQAISWLAKLARYLEQSAHVVYFAVSDDANAYQIFETLNDRGLELSIADLLKNYLLGKAGADADSVLSAWTRMLTTLRAGRKEEAFTAFLRHFWSSTYEVVRDKQLYRRIKSRIRTRVEVNTFTNDLERESYYYSAMLSPEHEYWASDNSRTLMRTLLSLGVEQYRPFLLPALDKFAAKPQQIEELLSLLINWSVRLFIVGGGGGGVMERNYAELGQAIRAGELKTIKEVAKRAERFVPGDASFRDSFAVARVSKDSLARYYLRELEVVARANEGRGVEELPNSNARELTLEHILPERPGSHGWAHFSDETRRAYTNRLGNMCLLLAKSNHQLKSAAFAKKKGEFKKSTLVLTRELTNERKWTVSSLEERQHRLADLAVERWPRA